MKNIFKLLKTPIRFLFPKCGMQYENDLEFNRLLFKSFSEKIKLRWAIISLIFILFQNLLIYNIEIIYQGISYYYLSFTQNTLLTKVGTEGLLPYYWLNVQSMSSISLHEYVQHFHHQISNHHHLLNSFSLYFSEFLYFMQNNLQFCYNHFKEFETFSFLSSFIFGMTALFFAGIEYIVSLPEDKAQHAYETISGDKR